MKQVTILHERDRRDVATVPAVKLVLPPLPPSPWFVRGPRGGIYEAVGPITVEASDAFADYFIRNKVAIKFSSAARYVRPGSRRHVIALYSGV